MKKNQPAAQNRYRQVRMTYTEEAGGRLSYSIYVKPLNAAWTEQNCLVRGRVDAGSMAESVEDVFLRLALVLEELLLPRSTSG